MSSDCHIHLDERIKKILIHQKIPAIISCTTPEEVATARKLCKVYPFLSYSCGIHPWFVEKISWEMMEDSLQQANIIGEIGMDSVWCSTNRNTQLEVFKQQVAYASTHHKPVILHTKGEEKTIVDLIEKYPNTYLVHWYSCMEYLGVYKKLNCYFSIGPDVYENESVQQVVREIELDHLLIESDGIAAIEWLVGHIEDNQYMDTLYQIALYIAQAKQMDVIDVLHQVDKNYQTFIGKN